MQTKPLGGHSFGDASLPPSQWIKFKPEEIQESGSLESRKSKKANFSELKSVRPKRRQGPAYYETTPPDPFVQFQTFSHGPNNFQK